MLKAEIKWDNKTSKVNFQRKCFRVSMVPESDSKVPNYKP